jgi:hypothetical protein
MAGWVLTDDDERRLRVIEENEAAHRCRARMKEGTAVYRCWLYLNHEQAKRVPVLHLCAGVLWPDDDPRTIEPVEVTK